MGAGGAACSTQFEALSAALFPDDWCTEKWSLEGKSCAETIATDWRDCGWCFTDGRAGTKSALEQFCPVRYYQPRITIALNS